MEHAYGYIKDNKVYLKGFLNQEDRVIGEVKEDPESTLKYFEDRFQMVKEKVEGLKKDIAENQNKGSFLMKLIHLRDSLMHYDALGDFVPLIEDLNRLEAYLEEIIAANRQRNLDIKRGLILEAQELMRSTDWKNASLAFKDLKQRWLKTGPVDKIHEKEIDTQFTEALNTFFENRKKYFEDLALQAEENIKTYEALLEQARRAFDMPDAKQAFEISKRIQKEWKSSGKVPAEKRQPIWDEFSKLNNRIFSRFKRSAQTGPTLSPGLVIKKIDAMAQEMKKLASQPSSPEVVEAAKKLQMEWKKLPPKKPRDAQQSIRSFVFSTDIVFEKSFLEKLVHSKYKDFDEKEPQEQIEIKTHILKDLIYRDQKELETIQGNSENFRTNEGNFEIMLHRKINGYKRKVDVKNHLLKEISKK